jgi:hypothetical protein
MRGMARRGGCFNTLCTCAVSEWCATVIHMNEYSINSPKRAIFYAVIGAVVCFTLAILIVLFVIGKEPMVSIDDAVMVTEVVE